MAPKKPRSRTLSPVVVKGSMRSADAWTTLARHEISNRLPMGLSADAFDMLAPALEPRNLAARDVLEAPGKIIEHTYFIQSGFASVTALAGGDRVEIALIGREGMTGLPAVLHAERGVHLTIMESTGRALRVETNILQVAIEGNKSLRQALSIYASAFHVQVATGALANGCVTVEGRLARRLLMIHDRIDGDEVPVTHESMALAMGVRRASVTAALNSLEAKGLVGRQRGSVAIIKRKSLEKLASAYGAAEVEYERLTGSN